MVSRRRYSDTAVRPFERSIENFVIVRNEGSWPMSVMSVPCSVVMICTELPESSSISREIVGRILEERIADDIHLVIENPGGEVAQAEGLLVRDEVDLVAARRERYAELRRDGAGSAVRGIAGDADLHASIPPSSVAFHQRIACSSASGAPGSIIVTRFAGSWCLNQVRCRFAYCRVSVRTFANASSREHSFATAARIHL